MLKIFAPLFIGICLLAVCGRGPVDQTAQLPAEKTDIESFPLEFKFLHDGKPVPVRAYFMLNG